MKKTIGKVLSIIAIILSIVLLVRAASRRNNTDPISNYSVEDIQSDGFISYNALSEESLGSSDDTIGDIYLSTDGETLYSVDGSDPILSVFHRDKTTGQVNFSYGYSEETDGYFDTILEASNYLFISNWSSIYVYKREDIEQKIQRVFIYQNEDFYGLEMIANAQGSIIYGFDMNNLCWLQWDREKEELSLLGQIEYDMDHLTNTFSEIAISPNGEYLYAYQSQYGADDIEKITLYSIDEDGSLTMKMDYTGLGIEHISDFCIHPNGTQLYISGRYDHIIYGYDLDPLTGYMELNTSSRVPYSIDQMNYLYCTPDGEALFVTTVNSILRFDIDEGALEYHGSYLDYNSEFISGLLFPSDNLYFYAALEYKNEIKIFNR